MRFAWDIPRKLTLCPKMPSKKRPSKITSKFYRFWAHFGAHFGTKKMYFFDADFSKICILAETSFKNRDLGNLCAFWKNSHFFMKIELSPAWQLNFMKFKFSEKLTFVLFFFSEFASRLHEKPIFEGSASWEKRCVFFLLFLKSPYFHCFLMVFCLGSQKILQFCSLGGDPQHPRSSSARLGCPKASPRVPQSLQMGPKSVPKWIQNGSRIGPRGSKIGSRLVLNSKRRNVSTTFRIRCATWMPGLPKRGGQLQSLVYNRSTASAQLKLLETRQLKVMPPFSWQSSGPGAEDCRRHLER